MSVAATVGRGGLEGGGSLAEVQLEYERMLQVERRDARRAAKLAALEARAKAEPGQLGGGMDAKAMAPYDDRGRVRKIIKPPRAHKIPFDARFARSATDHRGARCRVTGPLQPLIHPAAVGSEGESGART